MKILMPILHYPPVIGGFEVFCQNIAEGISKTDDVFVITSKVINIPKKEIKGRLRIFRTSPWILQSLSYSKPWFIVGAMVWILFRSLKLIKKEKIDLIHAQGFLSGILGYILKKITKLPYLITIQSADFSVYHPRLNINFIKWIYQKIEKKIFKKADFCHAVSNHLEKHFKTYKTKKTIVIPNGVSQERFKPDLQRKLTRKELGFDTENLIVCVSRLEHKNGTHDLVEAGNILNRRYTQIEPPDVHRGDTQIHAEKIQRKSAYPEVQNQRVSAPFKVIIIGDGSDREKLKKMIEKFNLKNKVFILGDILHKELPKYVACADIFIRPSLAEGFGIVFIEAMAAEVAVIATPVGGIPDFLHNNETGLFCEPGNPEDIAEKIKILIENKELRNKLIRNAKQMVGNVYNWDKISERLRKVYKEVLNQ